MSRKSLTAAAVMLAACVSTAAASENYWLITEVSGRWEYREGADKPRQLTGHYEPIRPEGFVRCLEPDTRQCVLRYPPSTRSRETQQLNVKLPASGEWVSLSSLKPPPPALPATTSDLASRFVRVTRPGGSRSASACGGNLPMLAPVCGENLDVSAPMIRWDSTLSGSVAILVERADGEPALFRGAASGAAGAFADAALSAFLRRLQHDSAPVDVIVRLMAEGGRSAVRIARIPPSSRTDSFESRLRALGSATSVAAIVTRLSLALEEGMWSRAAEEARDLIPRAGNSASILEYAVLGVCQSDFEEEKALLRRSLRASRYDEICASASTADSPPIDPPRSEPPPIVPVAGSPTRLGIALVIGNSEYWNTPLNSVKSDVRSMSETLQAAGFAVRIRENLRTPRQFLDSLDELLKEEAATPDDVLLVYFSGHGLQLDGRAQLLSTGVSATARVAEDLRDNAQSAEELLAHMERSLPGTRVLIVEACRDDLLAGTRGSGPTAKGGFAFQQDDVPNTFVMFANRPGATTPVRSEYGLMGPFTEALVHALHSSTGEILDVFATAASKTIEISRGQEPVIYHSKHIGPVVLRPQTRASLDSRARELLNAAEGPYRARAWDEFHSTVVRAKALTSDEALQSRLADETRFAEAVMQAEAAEKTTGWAEAAPKWQEAARLFAAREWVSMKAAVAWLLADDLTNGVACLAALATQSDSEVAARARKMVADLTRAFPELAPIAEAAARQTTRLPSGAEFQKLQDKE